MSNLIERIRQFIESTRSGGQALDTSATNAASNAAPTNVATLEDESALTLLMQLLEQTQEGEYSCSETFDLLDEYVEIVAGNPQEAAHLMPYVKRHLDHCKDCTEQYETLLLVLQGS